MGQQEEFERRKDKIRRAKKRNRIIKLIMLYAFMIVFCVVGVSLSVILYDYYKDKDSSGVLSPSTVSSEMGTQQSESLSALSRVELSDGVTQSFVELGSARKGLKLTDFKGIVIHNTGKPKVDSGSRREELNNEGETVCPHFIVGLDGEIVMCLPLDEQGSAAGVRNADTISIEYCHTSLDGHISKETQDALIKLCAQILKQTGLSVDILMRHYDATGAECPPYFVEHEASWETFKSQVETKMQE